MKNLLLDGDVGFNTLMMIMVVSSWWRRSLVPVRKEVNLTDHLPVMSVVFLVGGACKVDGESQEGEHLATVGERIHRRSMWLLGRRMKERKGWR